MPELAEVEFFRKQWDPGLGDCIQQVAFHRNAWVFRDRDPTELEEMLSGARFVDSQAHGKRLLFRLEAAETKQCIWLGLHLGMTGKLSAGAADIQPDRHDHLVLFQKERALLFTDPRKFGRVQWAQGAEAPEWWRDLPPEILDKEFTHEHVEEVLERRKRTPIKSVILMQEAFPGIGNWMADEILWRAEIDPGRPAGDLTAEERRAVWREVREVARVSLRTIGEDYRDPPAGWLFHERWGKKGKCPGTEEPLQRKVIGGRTTCWCPERQK